jgi:hypothetical protein
VNPQVSLESAPAALVHAAHGPRLGIEGPSYPVGMPTIELLYWDGCPSHPDALADLRAALVEFGRAETVVRLTEISSQEQAERRGFVGSPTLLVDDVDLVPAPAGEPAGLSCRVYRRRDGRYSPTPDPDDLRDALRRVLFRSAQEA